MIQEMDHFSHVIFCHFVEELQLYFLFLFLFAVWKGLIIG